MKKWEKSDKRKKRWLAEMFVFTSLCLLTACGEEEQKPTKLEDMAHDMSSIAGANGEGKQSQENSDRKDAMPRIYEEFLKGNSKMVVADWFEADEGYSPMEEIGIGEEYTLAELVDFVTKEVYEERFDRVYSWDLQYALMDCGGDGEPELALRINNVGIDGPEDGSTTTLVLKKIDGKVVLCDSFDTWSRSEDTLYYYGYRQGGGSSGAGDHIYQEKIVTGSGRKYELFRCESLMPGWLNYINEEAVRSYTESYGKEYDGSLCMDVYQIDGQQYISYAAEEGEKEAENLIALFKKKGSEFTDSNVIEEKIAEYKEKLGISEEWCIQKELEWHKLDGGAGGIETGMSIPEGQILEQSFEVELDGWGKVTFAAFEPEPVSGNSIWAYGDARFMLIKENQVIYTFPGCYNNQETGMENVMAGQQFGQVLSVAFRDYNGDGRKDILLILEYAGVQGNDIGQSWQEVRAYTQEEGEKEFHLDRLLMEQLRYYSENMEQVYEGIENYSHGYAVCTDISTWEVERFAKRVRRQILDGDFESIADEIAYPITVDGNSYADRKAFLEAGFVKDPNASFLDAIRNETGELMFCNWQGIMLGNGEIWFSEVLNRDGSSQGLKITGINGITADSE